MTFFIQEQEGELVILRMSSLYIYTRLITYCLLGAVQTPSSCTSAGCEHDCREVEGIPECFCFKGFKQDGRSCHGKHLFIFQ